MSHYYLIVNQSLMALKAQVRTHFLRSQVVRNLGYYTSRFITELLVTGCVKLGHPILAPLYAYILIDLTAAS